MRKLTLGEIAWKNLRPALWRLALSRPPRRAAVAGAS